MNRLCAIDRGQRVAAWDIPPAGYCCALLKPPPLGYSGRLDSAVADPEYGAPVIIRLLRYTAAENRQMPVLRELNGRGAHRSQMAWDKPANTDPTAAGESKMCCSRFVKGPWFHEAAVQMVLLWT